MTADQQQDLERVLDDSVRLVCWKDTVRNPDVLLPVINQVDVVAAVLPLTMLAELMKLSGGKPVLQSVSGRIPTGEIRELPDGREEQEFAFAHRYWERILRLEIETRRL